MQVKTIFKISPYILLVEDDELSQFYMMEMIKTLGAKADLAKDGYKSLKMFKKNSYDLILMDIKLPNMSGTETAIKMKKQKKNHCPLIVGLSAAAQYREEECLKAGMDGIFNKPIKYEEFMAIFEQYLPQFL